MYCLFFFPEKKTLLSEPSFGKPEVNPKRAHSHPLHPGLLSLCLSENDDNEDIKLDPEYRNVEFLITTGPEPCPEVDYKNIVFDSVLEGMFLQCGL